MPECLVILDVALGKHVIRQGFQLSERHVLHGMLYLANQLVSLEIVVIAQARSWFRERGVLCQGSVEQLP